jgi:raffinose/stachyose/melibiose transport system permease protein
MSAIERAQRVRKRRSFNAPGTVLLVAAMLYSVVPLLSMFSAALQPEGTIPFGLQWPADPQWHNFVDAWNRANLTTLLGSSSLIVLGVLPATLVLSFLASYAITLLRIPLGRVFFFVLLVGLTLPGELTILPLYRQMQDLGLLNNRIGLCLALIGLNMPFAIFWMRAHFLNMPIELTEAAEIDGAGRLQALRHIHIPLAGPALASLTLLLFLGTWNNFLLTIVLISDQDKRTMAAALQYFVNKYSTDLVLLNAGSVLLMAPVIIVFLILQRYFVRALLEGGVKG